MRITITTRDAANLKQSIFQNDIQLLLFFFNSIKSYVDFLLFLFFKKSSLESSTLLSCLFRKEEQEGWCWKLKRERAKQSRWIGFQSFHG